MTFSTLWHFCRRSLADYFLCSTPQPSHTRLQPVREAVGNTRAGAGETGARTHCLPSPSLDATLAASGFFCSHSFSWARVFRGRLRSSFGASPARPLQIWGGAVLLFSLPPSLGAHFLSDHFEPVSAPMSPLLKVPQWALGVDTLSPYGYDNHLNFNHLPFSMNLGKATNNETLAFLSDMGHCTLCWKF